MSKLDEYTEHRLKEWRAKWRERREELNDWYLGEDSDESDRLLYEEELADLEDSEEREREMIERPATPRDVSLPVASGDSGMYAVGRFITWVIVFVGCWIYCVAAYGFLLGVGLGWLPSLIVATIAAVIWPLLAILFMLLVAVVIWFFVAT